MMSSNGKDYERRTLDIGSAHWDVTPYSVALEIKRLLGRLIDQGTSIDSGHGLLWPRGAPDPIEGHAEADLHPVIGGVEFYLTIRKSNNQLIKEGVTRDRLGLPEVSNRSAMGEEPNRE